MAAFPAKDCVPGYGELPDQLMCNTHIYTCFVLLERIYNVIIVSFMDSDFTRVRIHI